MNEKNKQLIDTLDELIEAFKDCKEKMEELENAILEISKNIDPELEENWEDDTDI